MNYPRFVLEWYQQIKNNNCCWQTCLKLGRNILIYAKHQLKNIREPLKTSLTANFLRLCTSSALAKLEIHQVFTAFRCLEAAQSPNENLRIIQSIILFRFLENPISIKVLEDFIQYERNSSVIRIKNSRGRKCPRLSAI